MVLPKSRNTVGLGHSLMKDRFRGGKSTDRQGDSSGIRRKGQNGETYVTKGSNQDGWMKMRSITEQAALDEFLSTAELAGTDFTAEKLNTLTIVHPDQHNPFLLSADDERKAVSKHAENKNRLTVPRRPPWHEEMTKDELDSQEKASFLDWRRVLAELQESNDLLMTPFERNLEVWRQLWRVVERSDLVVQIVDARNPLLFRSEDLGRYVKEVDAQKENLLLVNKADLMTRAQRKAWADYFQAQGIAYRFFSAFPKEANAGPQKSLSESPETDRQQVATGESASETEKEPLTHADAEGNTDDTTRILTPQELDDIFLTYGSNTEADTDSHKPIQVGLVGYPNVGKSSTINALIGTKKVSVSATPGKTKHFQTIHLSESVILCDCPGLVFPNFATTKAELVCNGILPIDQLREFTGPVGLVSQRIPQAVLEAAYGIRIHTRPLEEGGSGIPTAEELLVAYAVARGFTKTGQGQPDESRAARYILKDYVSGKLLFCHPPPNDPQVDPRTFNAEVDVPRPGPSAEGSEPEEEGIAVDNAVKLGDSHRQPPVSPNAARSTKSSRIDAAFFKSTHGNQGHLTMPFNHKYTEQGAAGKQLSGRKQREMVALANGVGPGEVAQLNSKKHFKGKKGKATTGRDE